jgi:hypothetical protein
MPWVWKHRIDPGCFWYHTWYAPKNIRIEFKDQGIPEDVAQRQLDAYSKFISSTPKETKMSRSATVRGSQEIVVRIEWIVELDDVEDKDDAEQQAIAIIEQDGPQEHEDYREETDWRDIEVGEVELEDGEFNFTLSIEGVRAEDKVQAMELINDRIFSEFAGEIIEVEEV